MNEMGPSSHLAPQAGAPWGVGPRWVEALRETGQHHSETGSKPSSNLDSSQGQGP